MNPTTIAHVEHVNHKTLDQLRAEWQQLDAEEFSRRKEWKRKRAARTWPLFVRWSMEKQQTSRRAFAVWLTGEADPSTTLYDTLAAGMAIEAGLDYGLGVSDLALLGRAMEAFSGASRVQEMLEDPDVGIQGIRKLLKNERQEGEVKLPVSELPVVRAAIKEVSDSESLEDGAALALIVQAHNALPDTVRHAAIESAKTGKTLEDSARIVVAQMLDPRHWLSQQMCFVPGCNMHAQELNHVRLPDGRYRSQEILIPLCRPHHQAQPGGTADAFHGTSQHEWILRWWGSEEAFWRDIVTLYASRLFGDGAVLNPVNVYTDQEPVTQPAKPGGYL